MMYFNISKKQNLIINIKVLFFFNGSRVLHQFSFLIGSEQIF